MRRIHSTYSTAYFCIRGPRALLKSSYPVITQGLNRKAQRALCNFKARLQNSLAVPKQQPPNPHMRHLFLKATQTRCPLLGHSLLHEPKRKMHRSFAMLKSGTRGGSGLQGLRPVPKDQFFSTCMRHLFPNTQSHALPTSGSLAIAQAQMQMRKLLAMPQS